MAPSPPAPVEAAAEWLRKHFDADSARAIRVTYELDLTGPGGGCLAITIDDGSLCCAAAAGAGRVDARFRVPASYFFGLLAGTENAELLFMAGRITIDGDLSQAMRFRKFFARRA